MLSRVVQPSARPRSAASRATTAQQNPVSTSWMTWNQANQTPGRQPRGEPRFDLLRGTGDRVGVQDARVVVLAMV